MQDNCIPFVKCARELLEHTIWLSDRFSRGQAWVDLFCLANHKDTYFFVRGNKVDVKRGQLAWSMRSLAKRWKWNKETVVLFLRFLSDENMVAYKADSRTTLITIVNYDKWQNNPVTDQRTDRSQNDHRPDTYKKLKNDKNVKKTTIAEASSAPRPYEVKGDLAQIVSAYKVGLGFEVDDRAWDKLYMSRFCKAAKDLLEFLGSVREAIDCVSQLSLKFREQELTYTLETIVNHAGEWKLDRPNAIKRNAGMKQRPDGSWYVPVPTYEESFSQEFTRRSNSNGLKHV